MMQLQEGQRVRGRNGEMGTVRNGVVVVENVAPASIAVGGPNPRAPIDLRRAGAEADTATATAPYAGPRAAADTQRAIADAAKAALEAQQAQRLAELAARQQRELPQIQAELRNVIGAAQRARELSRTGNFATGFGSSIASSLEGTSARDLWGLLNTVGSNTAFDRLSRMRAESPTGGALGSITERELELLRDSVASLDQGASDEEFQRRMGVVIQHYSNMLNRLSPPANRAIQPAAAASVAAPLPASPRTSGGPSQPSPQNPFTPQQVAAYDAWSTANPNASPEQVQAFVNSLGVEGTVANAADIARMRGQGAQVGSAAGAVGTSEATGIGPQVDDASPLAQTLSGVNEGIATTLGAPVDLANLLYGTALHGVNAIAGTDFQPSARPLLGGAMLRDFLTGTGSIAPERDSPFMRRVGQSLGAAAVPVAATAGTVRRAATGFLTAGGGGVGAATAREVAPDNPVAELAGEMIGSAGSGASLFGFARRNATRAAEAAVPSVSQLRQQAGDLYTAAENRGVVAGPNVTGDIAGRVRDIARNEELITPTGRVSEAYPRAAEAMKLLDDYAGVEMNPRQIQVIRETLGDAIGSTQGKERRIASMMLSAFDDATVPLAPELAQARDVASRYLQAGRVQRAIDLAEPRAAGYTQSGSGNALRAEFRNLDRRMIRGQDNFGVEDGPVQDAIERVSRGDARTNILRNIGRLAPKGPVSTGMSAGIPFLIGNAIGGPGVGAAASAGTMATGAGAHFLANRATANQARIAEMLARAGGEVPVEPVMSPEVQRMIAAMLAGQTANAGADY